MQIRFAQTRPAGDYALVIPAAGSQRPGLAGLGDGIQAVLRRQRFEGEAGGVAELFLDQDGGRRLLVIGLGADAKPDTAAEKLGGTLVARLLTSGETEGVLDLSGLNFDAASATFAAASASETPATSGRSGINCAVTTRPTSFRSGCTMCQLPSVSK